MHSSNLSTPNLQDNHRTAALSIQEVSRQIFEQSYIQDQDIRFQHTLSIIAHQLEAHNNETKKAVSVKVRIHRDTEDETTAPGAAPASATIIYFRNNTQTIPPVAIHVNASPNSCFPFLRLGEFQEHITSIDWALCFDQGDSCTDSNNIATSKMQNYHTAERVRHRVLERSKLVLRAMLRHWRRHLQRSACYPYSYARQNQDGQHPTVVPYRRSAVM
jgi:hypothetical protein